MDAKGNLLEKIESASAYVGIVGMGYVGLPLACVFAEAGFTVTGFDVDGEKVKSLNSGHSYIKHIPSHLIVKLTRESRFCSTTDYDKLSEMDAILICVPTPLTASREPDLSHVISTSREIAARLKTGQLVVLESTTYPGTTRELLLPLLEGRGLTCGSDFFLAYSPERENPSREGFQTSGIPKLIGGVNAASAEVAFQLYAAAIEKPVLVSSSEIAESAKILENIYRAVNIAMVNELKVLFNRMGIDIWEVIDAASTKPFGYQPFYPGPGLGGHCIPIDPFYLSWKARQYNLTTRFIELAGEINAAMPEFVVERAISVLNDHGKTLKGSRVLLLGVAYKKDVDDYRESPAFRLWELLEEKGARVSYHDPYCPRFESARHRVGESAESVELTDERLAEQDLAIIVTDHSDIDYGRVVEKARLVLDTRNATRKVTKHRERIFKA